MDFVLASNNKKKIVELRDILGECLPDLHLLSLRDVGFEGDIVEDGDSFEANALIKARTAMKASDDSGLCVDALDGAPGIFSARYAGEHANDEANNELLLKKLENVPDGERTAHFVCVIACVLPDGREITVRGETEGSILRERAGEGGFGYDPLFLSTPYGKTFAELTSLEKNAISHRGRAIAALAMKLADEENI